MKVGIQTIAWGHEKDLVKLLPTMAAEIKKAKYEGIELFQPARDVHQKFVRDSLLKHNLELVGVTGGAFKERVDFVRGYHAFDQSKPMPYVYTDEWPEAQAIDALKRGVTVAIHPHMFKPIQTTSEAIEILDRLPSWTNQKKLRLLPDSAHQEIAGEPILDVLKKHLDKIDNIHLKDWTPEFGRSYQFYAQGFVPLGDGDVPLEKVLKFLKGKGFKGWLIVEQDVTDTPFQTADSCRKWLRKHGI